MNTSMRIKLAIVLALAAVLGGCSGPCSKIEPINGPTLAANGVDLSTYVAVGTSLSSGYESGGLVDRHQVHSFPSLFATQLGKTVQIGGQGTFTQPTVDFDGIPALLEIKSYSPLIIDNSNRTTGAPTNLSQNFAYHNLGIPGAILLDLVDTTHYHNTVPPVNRQNFTYFNLIQRGRGTLLAQALSLNPTILSLEYGANELLGPATAGVAPSNTTGANFAQLMTISLNSIHAALPGTKVAVFNLPDVTTIPYFTTFPPFTVSTITGAALPLVGAAGPLQFGDLVLLPAAAVIATGTGIPTGGYNYVNPPAGSNGQLLPENLILRAGEVAAAHTEIDKMNAVVDSVATRPFVTRVDFAGLLSGISANGIQIGTNLYTSAFITGGLFGLDGIHPNDLGYALMANQMIDAVNARFGSAIPQVNPLQYASPSASRARPAGQTRYPVAVDGLQQELEMLYPRFH
jgi:lysophospholipase L1-like esterase